MNGTGASGRNTGAPYQGLAPMPATDSENVINYNSVNDAEASAGSNSSSSTVRVNNRSDSFASAMEAPAGGGPDDTTPVVSPERDLQAEGEGNTSSALPERSASDTCGTYIGACAHLVQRYLAYFDGTSATLRFCHGASVPSVPGLRTPEGYQDFTLAWSGIAFAVFAKILTDDLPDKKEVADMTTPGISTQIARALMVEALVPCVGDAIGSRRYSYDNSSSYAQSIQDCSEEMMRRWVEARPALPAHIAARYTNTDDELKSLDDLDVVLMQTMMVWVSSFFPFYQSLKRQGGGSDIHFFWLREAPLLPSQPPSVFPSASTLPDSTVPTPSTASPVPARDATSTTAATPLPAVVVPDDDFLFSVHAFCSYENRMVNADGAPRGCVVPRRWLQQFMEWLAASVRHSQQQQPQQQTHDNDDSSPVNVLSEAAALTPPGPLNTFQCVELAAGSPNRHWLAKGELNGRGIAESVEAYEVVPEGLFDVLALRFGCGPKYMTYAPCSFLEPLMNLTRPQPVRATVACTVSGKPRLRLVGVIEEALLRTPLSELLRVTLCRHRAASASKAHHDAADNSPTQAHPQDDISDYLQKMLTAEGRHVELEIVVPQGEKHAAAHKGNEEDAGAFHAILDSALSLDTGTVFKAVQQAYEEHNRVFAAGVDVLEVTLNVRIGSELGDTNQYVQGPGVCGLTNVGNTCYMNSALQALSNVKSFRRAFFGSVISRFPRAVITQAYMQLMMDIWSGRFEYVETYALKKVIGERVPRFAGYDQQDANELIEVLLDHVGEELNTVSSKLYRDRRDTDAVVATPELAQTFWDDFLRNNKSFVPREFFHQSKTVFTCLSCGEKTRVFDNNLTLGLSIKDVPVQKFVRVNVLLECDVSALVAGPHGAAALWAAVSPSSTTTMAATGNNDEPLPATSNASPLKASVGTLPTLPLTHIRFPICPSVQVAVQPNNSILPVDLSAALRECLTHNAAVRYRIKEAADRAEAAVAALAASQSRTHTAAGVASDEEAISLTSSTSSAGAPPPPPAASGQMATDVVVNNDTALLPKDDDDSASEDAGPALALEFTFEYLEADMTMQRKPIVLARCTAGPALAEAEQKNTQDTVVDERGHGNASADSAAAPPPAAPSSSSTPPPTAAPAAESAPQYRVWYYLHTKSSFNDFQRGALHYPAYVEDLAAPADALNPPAPASPSGTEEEEGRSLGAISRRTGPLSQHILAVGQALGDTLLEFNAATTTAATTTTAAASGSKPTPSATPGFPKGRLGGQGSHTTTMTAKATTAAGGARPQRLPRLGVDKSSSSRSSSSGDDDEDRSSLRSSSGHATSNDHSSRDGDDERDAGNPAVHTPLPNPVEICFATFRDTRLRPIVELQSQDGDAWIHAEWFHAREAEQRRQTPTGAAPTGTQAVSPLSSAPHEPITAQVVNVLVFVCYTFTDARVVREFSPLVIQPPMMREKEKAPQCTLSDCLARTSQEERLSDDDAWYCPQCKELRETVVKRTLFRLPPCLLMCFKRFKANSLHAEKNNTLISFPTELDMAPYLDPEAGKGDATTHYRLRSVVYHTGSLSYGHYTASAFNDSVQKWVYYNDTRASVEGLEGPTPVGAYILCYERADVV